MQLERALNGLRLFGETTIATMPSKVWSFLFAGADRSGRVVGTVVLLCLLMPGMAPALETDQYYAWGRPLADSTHAVNAKFNLELQRAIDSFETPPNECVDISVRFRSRMRFLLFHPIQLWAMHSELVATIPADAADDTVYRRTNLYSRHSVIDTGMWMPFTPTIEIDGVRMGTDKLSHFVSSGWTYYSTYRNALEKGQSNEEADRAAARRGLQEEKLILGAAASGILSLADVESSYQGMRFYRDFCAADDPIVARSGDEWVISRAIDLRDYVHPGWDESFQPSIFTKSRWKKVKPQLLQYCDLRDDPDVIAMLDRYRQDDQRTAVGVLVDELVAAGELRDPDDFSLDANCPTPDSTPIGLETDGHEAHPTPPELPPDELTERIITEEQDTVRRAAGMAAVRLNYPQIVSVSYGVMLTRLNRGSQCHMPCDMRGPFAQLEPGLGGGKFSLGWGHVIAEQRHGPAYFSAVFLAFGLKASVLHSWSSHSGVPSGQTYVGPEFEFSVARVNMGIGVMGRVSGDEGRDWIVTGLLGWGF